MNGYVLDKDMASLECVRSKYLPVTILKTAPISPQKDKNIILFNNAQLISVRQVKNDTCSKLIGPLANKSKSFGGFEYNDNVKAKPRPFTA